MMSDSEKLVACLRQIGFDAEIRPVHYTETFRGLAPPKDICQRVEVGCHFLFDADGKLIGLESEYDGWVTSVSTEAIKVVSYQTETIQDLGSRVVTIDLLFRDATHARKLLTMTDYHDHASGRSVYVVPDSPEIRHDGVVHTIRFRHVVGVK